MATTGRKRNTRALERKRNTAAMRRRNTVAADRDFRVTRKRNTTDRKRTCTRSYVFTLPPQFSAWYYTRGRIGTARYQTLPAVGSSQIQRS
uniref:Uncharacterized protein n=1 Tax=Oryza glumipatula TaxID=40148 RepID=A0A0D9YHY4_9ORYZ